MGLGSGKQRGPELRSAANVSAHAGGGGVRIPAGEGGQNRLVHGQVRGDLTDVGAALHPGALDPGVQPFQKGESQAMSAGLRQGKVPVAVQGEDGGVSIYNANGKLVKNFPAGQVALLKEKYMTNN